MSQALVVQEPREVQITTEQTSLIKTTICQGATDAEMKLFFYDCQRRGVHPLDKLIHFTKRDGKYTPITSIDFFRQRAHTSGCYAGEAEPKYTLAEDGLPDACTYTVYRIVQGQRCEWTATARWAEYYPGEKVGFMWRKMPFLMLAKCAEALALRKAFPAELQGLYVKEEMEQAAPSTPFISHKQTAQEKIQELRIEHAATAADANQAAAPVSAGEEPQGSSPAPSIPVIIWNAGTPPPKGHRGKDIRDVPEEYLTWYLKNGPQQEFIDRASEEIERRHAAQLFRVEEQA